MTAWIPLLLILGAIAAYAIIRNEAGRRAAYREFYNLDGTYRYKPGTTSFEQPRPWQQIHEIYDEERSPFENEDDFEIAEVDVVGESFKNPDGTERQKIIASLKPGDPIRLVAEPDNPYSKSGEAVAVFSEQGQIGYIGEDDPYKEDIFDRLTDGDDVPARIYGIYGGAGDKPHRGVVIELALPL